VSDDLFDSLLRIKLRRPRPPRALVSRQKLIDKLNKGLTRPLTMISAPAGYGKSALMSSWLEAAGCPSAWLSLDERDNNLRTFGAYLLGAIRTLFPEVGQETQSMLQSKHLPTPHAIAHSLIKDLDCFDAPFILALDDYHFIHEPALHKIIVEFLRYPPRFMHLAIATRMDPPLPLATYRAKGTMIEIRVPDLRFSEEETTDFLSQALGEEIERGIAKSLTEKTEGWVTGLCLAVLTAEHGKELSRIIDNLPEKSSYVTQYLFEEVLLRQAEEVRSHLLATSILHRFNSALCDAVCAQDLPPLSFKMEGKAFINWLKESNLFVIPLDEEGEWVRYHHLFQGFLQSRLEHRVGVSYIRSLYKRASHWFAENGFIDEAIEMALKVKDLKTVARLIEENRTRLMNEDQWYDLERWLSQIPEHLIHKRPELLLAKMWVLNFQFSIKDITPFLERAERFLELDPESIDPGEVAFFKGLLLFWQGEPEKSMKQLRCVLDQLPSQKIRAKIGSYAYFALSSQLSGQGLKVVQTYRKNLQSLMLDKRARFSLIVAIIFVYLLSGELVKAKEMANRAADLVKDIRNRHLESWISYFHGMIHYHWNDLETAAKYFLENTKRRYEIGAYLDIECYAGLILSYLGMGQTDAARNTLKEMMAYAVESGNPYTLFRARSAQARFWLLLNDQVPASRWLKSCEFSIDKSPMLYWLDEPRITCCRVQIARGTESDLTEAERSLTGYLEEARKTYNVLRQIELWLLLAEIFRRRGREEACLSALGEALRLARSGEYIRFFVELEPATHALLKQVSRPDEERGFLSRVLSACHAASPGAVSEDTKIPSPQVHNQALLEPLSVREMEVLSLLARGMRNKEIASRLYISNETVKKHVSQIIRKLDARNRQEAVSNAFKAGILSARSPSQDIH